MNTMSVIFIALPFSLLLHYFNLISAQTYFYPFCLGGNYTANSTYEANLDRLLLSITNNTTPLNSYKFINTSVGEATDKIYGVFQCRGDYTSETCKRFAVTATDEIKTVCPYKTEAIILYEECWFYYSNSSISSLQFEPIRLGVDNNLSQQTLFTPKLTELMDRLRVRAVSEDLFAVGKDNISDFHMVYGLVQCIQYLPRADCSSCLRRAVSEIDQFKKKNKIVEGVVFQPSCIAMFADKQFYLTPTPAPPPPPPPPPTAALNPGQETKPSRNIVIIIVPAVIVVLFLSMIPIIIHLCRKKGLKMGTDEHVLVLNPVQSLQLDFSTVGAATGNFSLANKLGEGGFGAVYKGTLPDGREIAVKRLAQNSAQGGEEFKNEVVLLSKLEHRNLVKLLGFCLEGDERLLIYEFLPNASLDLYLFDAVKGKCLDWETRYRIIRGIARGLLYLHEDSHLMIIHRDIKASNILLDEKINPKISDFGMARLFNVDQTKGNTNRIVGTFGYMAPEYACYGNFSVKSDVFSFGVLVLEIISGRKNTRYYGSQSDEYLLGNAWKHLLEGTSLELLEPSLGERYSPAEVIKCIHIGLLCVQDDVTKRPTMTSVVIMLNRNAVTLPLPSFPAFFNDSDTVNDMIFEEDETEKTHPLEKRLIDQSTVRSTHRSENEISISELYPR